MYIKAIQSIAHEKLVELENEDSVVRDFGVGAERELDTTSHSETEATVARSNKGRSVCESIIEWMFHHQRRRQDLHYVSTFHPATGHDLVEVFTYFIADM